MVRAIYFETLSSGMRARIDPASRLTKKHKLVEIVGISRGGVGSTEHNSPLRLITRRKPLAGLKIRITDY